MRMGRWALLALGAATAACASTIGPVVPSVQVLVVLDSLEDAIRIIPVDSPDVVHVVSPGIAAFNRHALAVRGQYAAFGAGSAGYVVDLAARHLVCTASNLGAGQSVAAMSFDDNGLLYAAIPATNSTPYVDPSISQDECASGYGYVRGGPTAFVSARSKFFIVAANAPACPDTQLTCPESRSWLTASDSQPLPPSTAPLPLGADSIPLSVPGNAQGAVAASDGFVYVILSGSGREPNARLSQVDPVLNVERKALVGFGTLPRYIATDGDRVFVASSSEGLMVYDTRSSQVVHDANSAIPLIGAPHGLAADDVGRIYVVVPGSCAAGNQGSIRVFGPDLVSKPGITVGRCPVAIGVTDIPAALYHFDN